MSDKKEKLTFIERARKRVAMVEIVGLGIFIVGMMGVMLMIHGATVYHELRGDEYMDDPSMPFDERTNATYTFTDDWLKDKYYRSMLWAVIPGVIGGAGYAVAIGGVSILNLKETHKEFCRGQGKDRYCSECGLKLSKLEKD